jgi:hypothetical protein
MVVPTDFESVFFHWFDLNLWRSRSSLLYRLLLSATGDSASRFRNAYTWCLAICTYFTVFVLVCGDDWISAPILLVLRLKFELVTGLISSLVVHGYHYYIRFLFLISDFWGFSSIAVRTCSHSVGSNPNLCITFIAVRNVIYLWTCLLFRDCNGVWVEYRLLPVSSIWLIHVL